MKLAKSLFLGTAAGLAAVAGAQAADLPVRAVAPVEYVRVCSTYGAGFFYIPGTETCLRVGGRVRFELGYVEPEFRGDNTINLFARGRVQLDARTATAYGLLRTLVRAELTRNVSGVFGGTTSPNITQAFIQFGGLTAGRTTSFFTNSDLPNGNLYTLRFYDYPDVNLLAYTFSFGNGFSATLSLEEPIRLLPSVVFPTGTFIALTPAGQRVPDVVGNVKYTGTWGSAQLSGAISNIRSNDLVVFPGGVADFPDTEFGWAVSAQVGVNLPMLARGDALWFAATYANGALNYLGFGANERTGVARVAIPDAFIDPVTGEIETARGWAIAAGIRHYWTPQLRSNLHGSYARVNFDEAAAVVDPIDGVVAGVPDFTEWRIGVNTIWTPVAGLDIGVEVLYTRLDPEGRFVAQTGNFPGTVELLDDDSAWVGKLRIQRDF